MKAQHDLDRIVGYLREQSQPVHLDAIVTAGAVKREDAWNALRYGIRRGTIERTMLPSGTSSGRAVYRWTGAVLPQKAGGHRDPVRHSFDALLKAWGIARVPPSFPFTGEARHRRLFD